MLTRDEIIEKLRSELPYLKEKYNVEKIGIFGSFAKEQQTPESDIDIVVEFIKPLGFDFVEFGEYLENLLGTKVDILTKSGIKSIRIKSIAQDIVRNIIYA